MRLETQMKLGESVSQLIKWVYGGISIKKISLCIINSLYVLANGVDSIIYSDGYRQI
jgi:hypothetical protein